jgi:hypothetical protein
MVTQGEIEIMVKSMQSEIDDLHETRKCSMEKYGGLTSEDNQDFHSELNTLVSQIRILEWVLS